MGLIKIALQYIKLGWSVIPIRARDKRPAIKSWEEYQNRLPTKTEIKEWFGKGERNIALITGQISGVDVVDIDSYKGKRGIDVDSPLKVNTPRGGIHLYFKHVEGVRPGVNAEIGVDLRGDASYVLLPPSTGQNGAKYLWSLQNGSRLSKIIKSLPATPTDVVEKIKKGKDVHFDLNDSISVGEGERNDRLHKASVSLVSKHGEEMAWKLILALNRDYEPPLPEKDLITLFKSAMQFVRKNPPKMVAQETEGWVEPTLRQDLERVKKMLLEGKTLGYPTGFPRLDDITGGLLPSQSYLVFGDTNAGKSLFVLNIMVYLARNKIKCLYFDLENSYVMTAERQLLVTEQGALTVETWREIVKEKKHAEFIDKLRDYPLRVYDLNKMNDRFGEITYDGVEKVMTEAVEAGVQVIAIDHLHYFEPSQKDFNKLADISRRLNDFCAKHNVVIIAVAHTKKGAVSVNKSDELEVRRPHMDDVAGASLITRHTKNIIGLQRNERASNPLEKKRTIIYVEKTKAGATNQFELTFNPDTLQFIGENYEYNPIKVMEDVKDISEEDLPF